MFGTCEDTRAKGKPATRERHDELLDALNGHVWPYSDLVVKVQELTGKTEPAVKALLTRLHRQERLAKSSAGTWFVPSGGVSE
jgi:hypothetical protein